MLGTRENTQKTPTTTTRMTSTTNTIVWFVRASKSKEIATRRSQDLSTLVNNYATFIMLIYNPPAHIQEHDFEDAFKMVVLRSDKKTVMVKKAGKQATEWNGKFEFEQSLIRISGLKIHTTNSNNDNVPLIVQFWYGEELIHQCDNVIFSSHCNSVNTEEDGEKRLGRPHEDKTRRRAASKKQSKTKKLQKKQPKKCIIVPAQDIPIHEPTVLPQQLQAVPAMLQQEQEVFLAQDEHSNLANVPALPHETYTMEQEDSSSFDMFGLPQPTCNLFNLFEQETALPQDALLLPQHQHYDFE